MERILLERRFGGAVKAIGEALSETMDALSTHGWCSEAKRGKLEGEIEELLVNARVFGNENRRDRQIHLQVCELPDRCEVRIETEGKGSEPATLTLLDRTSAT